MNGFANKTITSIGTSLSIIIITALAIVSTIATLFFHNDATGFGYECLFLLPLSFCMYYPFSRLSKIPVSDVPITVYRIILIIRLVIIPFMTAVTGRYSFTFKDFLAPSWTEWRQIAIVLEMYESVAIFATTEICIKRFGILGGSRSDALPSPLAGTFGAWTAVAIGVVGILSFSGIADRMYFIFANESTQSVPMSLIPCLFMEFSRTSQQVLLLLAANALIVRLRNKGVRDLSRSPIMSILSLVVCSVLCICIAWSGNRASIMRNTIIVLEVWFLLFPKNRMVIASVFGGLAILVLFGVSSYKWFGDTAATASTESFAFFADPEQATIYLQAYFNGFDAVSFGVGLKESIRMTPSILISDTLRNVSYLNQLPFVREQFMTSVLFNSFVNGYRNYGNIIPMNMQCAIHFGYILSPLYSMICVIILFWSDNKRRTVASFPQYSFWTMLCVVFGCFQMYNYTLMISCFTYVTIVPTLILLVSDWLGRSAKRRALYRAPSKDIRSYDSRYC